MKTLIDDECDFVISIMLTCNDSVARKHTGNYLSAIVNWMFELEADYIHQIEEVEEEIEELNKITGKSEKIISTWKKSKSYAVTFLDFMFRSLFNFGPSNWPWLEEIGQMFLNILTGGLKQLEVFMWYDCIKKLCDFMLGMNSPYVEPGERRVKMGGAYGSPNFTPLLEIVSYMILHTTPMTMKD